LNSVSFHRTQIADEALAGLSAAENLRDIEFLGTSLVGEGLRALAPLKIRSLTLNSEDATAEGLQCLAEFEHLEELYLNVKGLELDRLPSLKKLTRLTEISILNAMAGYLRRPFVIQVLQQPGKQYGAELELHSCRQAPDRRPLQVGERRDEIEIPDSFHATTPGGEPPR
jgi:hypothetical protein